MYEFGRSVVFCSFCRNRDVIAVQHCWTFGFPKKRYSDGRIIGVPWYQFIDPLIVYRCSSCGTIQKPDDPYTSSELREFNWWEIVKSLITPSDSNIPITSRGSVKNILVAMGQGFEFSDSELKILRLSLIRLTNDKIREHSEHSVSISHRGDWVIPTIRSLIDQFNLSNAEDVALGIECLRELGCFQEATSFLTKNWTFSEEESEWFEIQSQIDRCRTQDPTVFEMSKPEGGCVGV